MKDLTNEQGLLQSQPAGSTIPTPLVVMLSCGLAALQTSGVGQSPFLQFAFVGSLFIFASSRPSFMSDLMTFLLGSGLFAMSALMGRAPRHAEQAVIDAAAFLGAGSLVVGGASDQRMREKYWAMLGLPGFVVLSFAGFLLLPSDRIPSLDRYLCWADQYLGQPAFAMGRAFETTPWLDHVGTFIYGALPLAIALIYLQLPNSTRGIFCCQLVTAGFAGYLLYRICPAAGPRYAFGAAFPDLPPQIGPNELHQTILPGVRLNAMPSLHVTWALITARYAWASSTIVRFGMSLFLLLTIAATLGTGEHYGVDLIVAVPFAAVMMRFYFRFSAVRLYAQKLFSAIE